MEWVVLLTSLALVTFGAESLVRGASGLALRMGVSPLFVGLTIVGFGTSSPELAASLTATLQGSSDVSVGNVLGSNIFNVCVILGGTAVIRPICVELRAVRRDLLVAIAASVLPFLAVFTGGRIPAAAGALFVLGLSVYLIVAFRVGTAGRRDEQDLARAEVESTLDLEPTRGRIRDTPAFQAGLVVVGLVLLVFGARIFVTTAIDVARALGLSELLIGLTIVSVGTSLPELITSVVAARRGNPDIALGNVIGSNIFNVLGILGICAIAGPQAVSRQILLVDAPLVVVATIALVPLLRTGGCISRREGMLLVLGYAVYVLSLVVRGG